LERSKETIAQSTSAISGLVEVFEEVCISVGEATLKTFFVRVVALTEFEVELDKTEVRRTAMKTEKGEKAYEGRVVDDFSEESKDLASSGASNFTLQRENFTRGGRSNCEKKEKKRKRFDGKTISNGNHWEKSKKKQTVGSETRHITNNTEICSDLSALEKVKTKRMFDERQMRPRRSIVQTLKAMCSKKWWTPLFCLVSLREPVLKNKPTLAIGERDS
jgi:hypothetical protein